MPVRPLNYYAAAKVLGEDLGRAVAKRTGMSVVALRLEWVMIPEDPEWRDMAGREPPDITLTARDLAEIPAGRFRVNVRSRWTVAAGAVLLAGLASRTAAGAAAPTGFATDPACLEHRTGEGFPERSERIRAIVDRLESARLMSRLLRVAPVPAERWLSLVHSKGYIARVKRICSGLGEGMGEVDTPDVPVCRESFAAGLAAAGAVLGAVEAVADGRVRNAFCAVRPPGHHALKDRAMGFCLFNHVAVAARYLQRRRGASRILIVDWDVHHGNGTQAAFDRDPTVFYFSVHREAPFYPGTGGAAERGTGPGLGFTLNVPLPAGSGDAAFVSAVTEQLAPAATAFRPGFVLVSAGFDAHVRDPLGGMAVTTGGYARLTREVKALADKLCGGRLVSVLEGGYDLGVLAEAAEAHVRGLMGD